MRILFFFFLIYSVISIRCYTLYLHYLLEENHKIITKLIDNDNLFIKALRANGYDVSVAEYIEIMKGEKDLNMEDL